MPAIEAPPASPEAQAQMGPPGGPGFGPGVAQAQQQQNKGPFEVAVQTAEKILMGASDETTRPYVTKALATLKIGVAMSQQKQPQSAGVGAPPPEGGPMVQGPPVPGKMAG